MATKHPPPPPEFDTEVRGEDRKPIWGWVLVEYESAVVNFDPKLWEIPKTPDGDFLLANLKVENLFEIVTRCVNEKTEKEARVLEVKLNGFDPGMLWRDNKIPLSGEGRKLIFPDHGK